MGGAAFTLGWIHGWIWWRSGTVRDAEAPNERGYKRCSSRARTSAWVRLVMSSLPKILLICAFTVLTATTMMFAISPFDVPAAIRRAPQAHVP